MNELDGVQVGDTLAIPGRGMQCVQFEKVIRLTPTRAVTTNNAYRIKDGCRVGSDSHWGYSLARKATERDFAEVKMNRRLSLARLDFNKIRITEENIDDIEALIAKLKIETNEI